MRWTLLLLGAAACAGPGGSSNHHCRPSGPMLLVATTDFQVGALAALDPSKPCVADQLATVSGDPLVRTHHDAIYQLNRSGGDTLRRYDSGEWDAPAWEVALEMGANAHGLVQVDDLLVIPRYDLPQLALRSAVDGSWVDAIDLSEYADADGLPEADRIVVVDQRIFVALQRFDRTANPWVSIDGRVVEIDVDTRNVVQSWEVGPSPRVFTHPAEPGTLVVITGTYFAPDGELQVLDVDTGYSRTVLTEAERGVDLETYAERDGVGVVLTTDLEETGQASVLCLDWPGSGVREGPSEVAWFVDAVAGADFVWIAVRRGWGAGTDPGLLPLDVETCSAGGDRLHTVFEPYSLAWLD